MPKVRGKVKLPSTMVGFWKMESPHGVEVYKQSYVTDILEYTAEVTTNYYDNLLYINGGISGGWMERKIGFKQIPMSFVVPGQNITTNFKYKFTCAGIAVAGASASINLRNQLRTVVSVG